MNIIYILLYKLDMIIKLYIDMILRCLKICVRTLYKQNAVLCIYLISVCYTRRYTNPSTRVGQLSLLPLSFPSLHSIAYHPLHHFTTISRYIKKILQKRTISIWWTNVTMKKQLFLMGKSTINQLYLEINKKNIWIPSFLGQKSLLENWYLTLLPQATSSCLSGVPPCTLEYFHITQEMPYK